MTWVSVVVVAVVVCGGVVAAVAGAAWWLAVAFVVLGAVLGWQCGWAAAGVEIGEDDRLLLSRPVGAKRVDLAQVRAVRRSFLGGSGGGGGQVVIVTEHGTVPLSFVLADSEGIASAIAARNPNVQVDL